MIKALSSCSANHSFNKWMGYWSEWNSLYLFNFIYPSRVEGGNFTPQPSQNRAGYSRITRLLSSNLWRN